MTGICGGGTSGPKVGASAVVLVGSGTIATLLEQSGNPWLEFAAALLTLPELVLSTFCATDPPAMPTFTSAESSALLNVTFGADLTSGLAKFADLVRNLAWQQYCQCTSGALVVPPPVAPPAGTPIYQAPPPPSGQACFTFKRQSPTAALQIAAGNSIAFGGGSNSSPIVNVTAIRITATGTPSFGTGHQYAFNLFGSTDGGVGTSIGSSQVFPLSGTNYYLVNNPVPNNRFFYANLVAAGGGTGTTDVLPIIFELFCGGALPGVQQPCCPPDAATQSSLDLILKMVTLTQRQLAPFSYIHGEVDAGLSGNGSIACFGILGVKVDITTAPSRLGQVLGDPVSIWEAGWINIGTPDGFGPRHFITSDPFVVMPVTAAATVIGYSIPDDVVVTITQLVMES